MGKLFLYVKSNICVFDMESQVHIYFLLPLYNHKEFDLGHTWIV